jgi:thioredoxin-related protein
MRRSIRVFTTIITIFTLQHSAIAAELVMVDSRACFYCTKFHREMAPTYAASAVGQRAPLRKVSVYKRWPSDLAGVRRAPYTPVFILVDEGKEIGRFAGYKSPVVFWSRLNRLMARRH